MYNESRKVQFSHDTTMKNTYVDNIFSTFEEYEKQLEKDLCEFTGAELQAVISNNFGCRKRTLVNVLSYLKAYIRWCDGRGYPVSDDIKTLKIEYVEKSRNSLIASPIHLLSKMNKLFDSSLEETIDCLYRCYIWLGYAGMEEAETVKVKTSEVCFDTMTVEHDGRSYIIYREALQDFRTACSLTKFKYVNKNYKKAGDIYRDRFEGEYLFRGMRTAHISLNTIRNGVQEREREAGDILYYNLVRISGMFYQAYEMEMLGHKVNFDAYLIKESKKVKLDGSVERTFSKKSKQLECDLFDDYENWKAAFLK